METKIGNSKIEKKIYEVIRRAVVPVNIQYVAKFSGLYWGTARVVLLDMVAKGKICMQETTKTPIFWVSEKGKVGNNDKKRARDCTSRN